MSDIVIKAENLGKKYVIGHQAERGGYTALRDVLMQNARSLWSKTKDLATGKPIIQGDTMEDVWALKNVSFEIRRGETMGIIGRNGAGKSTLLKILSRITEPSTGRVSIKGRVASLLEVGTGFHPELSGRENIYLNGTILGMTRAEIKKKFDEIVAFAEVEKYLDTPVKRYSSGMYVRLAFAVAAHLEPEILVVDEVLAVGDASFQKKCLGKMGDVAKGGRTVLFVSHNMGAIIKLCQRSLWIDKGSIVLDGESMDITNQYQSQNLSTRTVWKRSEPIEPDRELAFLNIVVGDSETQSDGFFESNKAIPIEIKYSVIRHLSGCQIGVRLYNSEGTVIFTTTDADFIGVSALSKDPGYYIARFNIPENFLVPTTYYILVAAHLPGRHVYEAIDQAVVFEISPSKSLISLDGRLGVIAPLIPWETCQEKLL